MPKTTNERLGEFGLAVNQLLTELPQHKDVTDTLDYILGALYGLVHANKMGFADRKAGHFSFYRRHLADYSLAVAKGDAVNPYWTAGFYFNSGIQRLASAFDRIPQMLDAPMKKLLKGKPKDTTAKERMEKVNKAKCDCWLSIYYEVNAFKHSPEGRAAGRKVTMKDALSAFEEMLILLAASKPKLIAKYK